MSMVNALIFLVIRLFASYLGPGIGDILQQIVNSFMTREDPTDQIKKAQRISTGVEPEPDGVPDVPETSGGFDFSSLLGGLSGIFGGGGNKRPRASRRPTFTE